MSLQSKDIVNACKRRPLLSISVVLSVVLLAVYYFRMDMIEVVQTSLDDRSKVLKKLKANANNAAQLEEQIATLKEINRSFVDGALREGELAKNQQIFLRLETETGVKLVDLRPQSVSSLSSRVGPGSYVSMSFGITISGEYRQLLDFLKRLERAPALSKVANVSFGGSGEGIQTMSFNVDLLGIRK